MLLLGLFPAAAVLHGGTPAPKPAPKPANQPAVRTLVLRGPATNTTAEAMAELRLAIAIDGGKATATMQTAKPLAGTGRLEGLYRGGWCELSGRLDEGFSIRLCGVFDGKDFRGTYTVAVPGQPLQYGRFRLALQP